MGSSMEVAYLLERLEQTLDRLAMLMDVFASNRFLPRRIFTFGRKFSHCFSEQTQHLCPFETECEYAFA